METTELGRQHRCLDPIVRVLSIHGSPRFKPSAGGTSQRASSPSEQEKTKARMGPKLVGDEPIPLLRHGIRKGAGCRNSYFLPPPKLNKSVRSPRAGLFDGAYGLVTLGIGLGRLSRLRSVIGGSAQLYSMNFSIET